MTDSLLDAFAEAVAANGERTALVEGDGTEVSFGDLANRAEGFAAHWSSRGLARGDRVLIAMPVGADLYAALAAIWSLGATAVLPEPAMGLAGVRYAVQLAGCKGIVASGTYTLLRFAVPGLWFKPLYRPKTGGDPIRPTQMDPDDIALVSFTSGSTGIPKAIPRSHRYLKAQQRAVSPLLDSDADETDLVAFPVFVLINLAAGRRSVLPNWKMTRMDRLEPEALSNWIATQACTRALLPPALIDKLGRTVVPNCLTTVMTGGGPVFPDMVDRLTERRPGLRVIAVYGSTEAEPIAEVEMSSIGPGDRDAMMNGHGLLAGPPVAGLGVRIEDGEILVEGPHVNKGYLDPARDAETKIIDGDTVWHRTGDAGWLDADGRLWLLGRHGTAVDGLHPFAVETAARTWPGVVNAALVAMGSRPVLAIEGNAAHLNAWQTSASTIGKLAVRHLRHIPVDRRHRSKIDYAKLKALLAKDR